MVEVVAQAAREEAAMIQTSRASGVLFIEVWKLLTSIESGAACQAAIWEHDPVSNFPAFLINFTG